MMSSWKPNPNDPSIPKPESMRQIGQADINAEVAAARARRLEEAKLLYTTGLPDYLRVGKDEGLEGFKKRVMSKAVLDAVLTWNPFHHGNLIIMGITGVGKSPAAALLFRQLIHFGVHYGGKHWELARGMAWIDAEELDRMVRLQGRGRGEIPEVSKALNATLTFFDEVGSENDRQTITDITAARYKRLRPSVFIGGQTRDGLTAAYGAPLVRKMRKARGREPVVIEHFSKDTPPEVTGLAIPPNWNESAEYPQ